jgi:hypothetical protein
MLQQPNAEANSDAVDTDAIARILHQAAHWLTPKVIEKYHPDDFASWQSEQQNRLRLVVDEFLKLASQVPANQPATVDQFMEGAKRFRELIKVLSGMVLEEWLSAINALEGQAEEWAEEAKWRTRRVNKKMSESLIGPYKATQLLIFAEPNLYVLDPVARFVPGAQGAFDFGIQPSYFTTSVYRDDSGIWNVHLDFNKGVANGQCAKWDKDSFYSCIRQLGAVV